LLPRNFLYLNRLKKSPHKMAGYELRDNHGVMPGNKICLSPKLHPEQDSSPLTARLSSLHYPDNVDQFCTCMYGVYKKKKSLLTYFLKLKTRSYTHATRKLLIKIRAH